MKVRASYEYSSAYLVMHRVAEVGDRLIGIKVLGRLTEADRGAKSGGAARLLQRRRALIRAR